MPVTNEQLLEAIQRTQGRDRNGDAVTLAVLGTRLDNVEKGIGSILMKLDSGSETFKNHEKRIIGLEGKLGLFAGLNLLGTAIGSSIAGWLGMKH